MSKRSLPLIVLCVHCALLTLVIGRFSFVDSAQAERTEDTKDNDAAIVGLISNHDGSIRGRVRLGAGGPEVPISSEGYFTFGAVPAGCHDLIVETDDLQSRSFEDAACLEPGQRITLSIFFGPQ